MLNFSSQSVEVHRGPDQSDSGVDLRGRETRKLLCCYDALSTVEIGTVPSSRRNCAQHKVAVLVMRGLNQVQIE